jgi:hypothetical protein
VALVPIEAPPDNKLNVIIAIQHFIHKASRFRFFARAVRIITALGSVTILVLLPLWDPANGADQQNEIIFWAILVIGAVMSIVSALDSVFEFERIARASDTTSRALRRLSDEYKRYNSELAELPALNEWFRNKVYDIEQLIEDPRVYDIDFSLGEVKYEPSATETTSASPGGQHSSP